MTNEEKILEMLGSMQKQMDGMGSRMDGMGSRMDSMESKIDSKLEETEARLKAYIDEKAKEATSQAIAYAEGAIIPKFDLLADGHLQTQERLDRTEGDIKLLNKKLFEANVDIIDLNAARKRAQSV